LGYMRDKAPKSHTHEINSIKIFYPLKSELENDEYPEVQHYHSQGNRLS